MKFQDYNLVLILQNQADMPADTILDLKQPIRRKNISNGIGSSQLYVIKHHGIDICSGHIDHLFDLIYIKEMEYPNNVMHYIEGYLYADIFIKFQSGIAARQTTLQKEIDQRQELINNLEKMKLIKI